MLSVIGAGGASIFGLLVMMLAWIGFIALLVWAVARLFPRERRSDHELARDVIGQRYAAGEISLAEYQQAMRALGGDEGRPRE